MLNCSTKRIRPLRKSTELASYKTLASKLADLGLGSQPTKARGKPTDQPEKSHLHCSETSAAWTYHNPSMRRALLSAVIIGSSHSFCPAARSGACQRHGISSEPADAVGDDALVSTSETSDIATTATAAAAGATAVSAVATAAGTVCATGACTAAGAAATAAATGTAGAAAGTAGAGLLSQLAYPIAALGLSGALALQSGPEALMDQAAHSALYADAMRSNHPVVLEFYSNDCRHCRHAASSLAETAAAHPGTDWVMVDCQQPASRSLVEKYNVGPIPHFAFLDESKTLRRTEVGESGAKRADAVLRALEKSS